MKFSPKSQLALVVVVLGVGVCLIFRFYGLPENETADMLPKSAHDGKRTTNSLPSRTRLQEQLVQPTKTRTSSQLSGKDPESICWSLIPRHKEGLADQGSVDHDEGRFVKEERRFYREARLLALAFPDKILALASKEARNAGNDNATRAFFEYILMLLAKQGIVAACQSLEALIQDSDPIVASIALSALGSTDREGKHRDMYMDWCKRGSLTPYFILDQWVDQVTIAEMQRQVAVGSRPFAKEVLRRLDVLADPRGNDKLEAIIRHKQLYELDDPGVWAINMLRRRDKDRFLQVARSELDRTFKDGKEFWEQDYRKKPFAAAYGNDARLNLGRGLWPTEYDDLLVAYSEEGGRLSELEKMRLRTFGYGCDPVERLAELLEAH